MHCQPDRENSNNWLFYNSKQCSIIKIGVNDYVKTSNCEYSGTKKDEYEIPAILFRCFQCFHIMSLFVDLLNASVAVRTLWHLHFKKNQIKLYNFSEFFLRSYGDSMELTKQWTRCSNATYIEYMVLRKSIIEYIGRNDMKQLRQKFSQIYICPYKCLTK